MLNVLSNLWVSFERRGFFLSTLAPRLLFGRHTSKCDKHTSCHTSKLKILRFYRACHTCELLLPPGLPPSLKELHRAPRAISRSVTPSNAQYPVVPSSNTSSFCNSSPLPVSHDCHFHSLDLRLSAVPPSHSFSVLSVTCRVLSRSRRTLSVGYRSLPPSLQFTFRSLPQPRPYGSPR